MFYALIILMWAGFFAGFFLLAFSDIEYRLLLLIVYPFLVIHAHKELSRMLYDFQVWLLYHRHEPPYQVASPGSSIVIDAKKAIKATRKLARRSKPEGKREN
jgi:hypothetical protein